MPTRRVQDHIVNTTGNFDHQGFPTVAMSPNLVTEPTIWQQAYVTKILVTETLVVISLTT